ncbi:hypothetical protein BpHYR1_031802 [Brachionus plicatilis]|uniref:Uncharacterized protein n=1 Tax=Brachionus plicatilis TaxID=10195 RepID=A0A3M7QT89_BRAPC|nr:hypothetical protein BpHYR1_031802 [Brachionus plicatilis]
MSFSILVDNGEALISFSCTFLSNGSELTQSHASRGLRLRNPLRNKIEQRTKNVTISNFYLNNLKLQFGSLITSHRFPKMIIGNY